MSTLEHWHIVLVGGGAFLYRKAVREAFPWHRIQEVREPVFANMRGFPLAGMNFVLQAARIRPRRWRRQH